MQILRSSCIRVNIGSPAYLLLSFIMEENEGQSLYLGSSPADYWLLLNKQRHKLTIFISFNVYCSKVTTRVISKKQVKFKLFIIIQLYNSVVNNGVNFLNLKEFLLSYGERTDQVCYPMILLSHFVYGVVRASLHFLAFYVAQIKALQWKYYFCFSTKYCFINF